MQKKRKNEMLQQVSVNEETVKGNQKKKRKGRAVASTAGVGGAAIVGAMTVGVDAGYAGEVDQAAKNMVAEQNQAKQSQHSQQQYESTNNKGTASQASNNSTQSKNDTQSGNATSSNKQTDSNTQNKGNSNSADNSERSNTSSSIAGSDSKADSTSTAKSGSTAESNNSSSIAKSDSKADSTSTARSDSAAESNNSSSIAKSDSKADSTSTARSDSTAESNIASESHAMTDSFASEKTASESNDNSEKDFSESLRQSNSEVQSQLDKASSENASMSASASSVDSKSASAYASVSTSESALVSQFIKNSMAYSRTDENAENTIVNTVIATKNAFETEGTEDAKDAYARALIAYDMYKNTDGHQTAVGDNSEYTITKNADGTYSVTYYTQYDSDQEYIKETKNVSVDVDEDGTLKVFEKTYKASDDSVLYSRQISEGYIEVDEEDQTKSNFITRENTLYYVKDGDTTETVSSDKVSYSDNTCTIADKTVQEIKSSDSEVTVKGYNEYTSKSGVTYWIVQEVTGTRWNQTTTNYVYVKNTNGEYVRLQYSYSGALGTRTGNLTTNQLDLTGKTEFNAKYRWGVTALSERSRTWTYDEDTFDIMYNESTNTYSIRGAYEQV